MLVNVWLAVFAVVERVSPLLNPVPVLVKAKLPLAPTVFLTTTIVPRAVFSNEQVTVPPAVTTKLDGALPVPVQLELVRSHPVWVVSATLYVPGSLFVKV